MLLSFPVFAASIALGPERELAPSTTALRFNGRSAAIGASDDGLAALWTYPLTDQMYVTRLDATGKPIDSLGLPLPLPISSPAVAWNGREYVIAGRTSGALIFLRFGTDGSITGPVSVTIADVPYVAHLRLTFNGRELLMTWMTQSLGTQTLFGLMLNADLEVLVPQFTIVTRPATEAPPSIASGGRDFLVAWENAGTLKIVSEAGDVRDGASIAGLLGPTVVADASGFIALWHDLHAIHAARVTADGTMLAHSTKLVDVADVISRVDAASTGTELGVVWTLKGTLFAQRFDSAFGVLGEPRALSEPGDCVYFSGIAASRADVVASWTAQECTATQIVRAASLDESVETISATTLPSTQLDVAVASDGENALAIWSEQRDEHAARIFGALLDEDARVLASPIAISDGNEGHTKPRIAYGKGRYLVTWRRGPALIAQFVSRSGDLDGEPFFVAVATTAPELVWDGSQFVIVWTHENALRSARISERGFVTSGPALEVDGTITLADVVVGLDGEIAALHRVENAQRVSVRVATFRSLWSDEQTLISERRPCSSLACIDYMPLAIGWSGTRYLTVWIKSFGAGRQSVIQTSTLDGPPRDIITVASSVPEAAGEMVWSGSSFLFTYRSRGISASWLVTHIMRIDEDGQVLEKSIRLPEITSDAGSSPDLTLVRPNRAIVVYNRDPVHVSHIATPQRAVARSVVLNPRRRAVR